VPFPVTSANAGKLALNLTDVTGRCITTLGGVPSARAAEAAVHAELIVPSWVSALSDKIVPPEADRVYAIDDILIPSHDRVGTVLARLFPRYEVRIYQINDTPDQLLLVAVPNDLEIDPSNRYPRSLPFLIYLHPSPQDTPAKHRAAFPGLYPDRGPSRVADGDIPLFYKDQSGFPFVWDYIFFQFVMNIAGTGLPYQLKKADTPFVLVIPMIRSFQDGLGILGRAASLERCLLGIERVVFNDRVRVTDGVLPEVEWVSFAAFSISNDILNRFVLANGANDFARQKIREYLLFDPPPNNPNNRSTIVQNLIPLVTTQGKRVALYGEDPWYFDPLVRIIASKGISFVLTTDKIFNNSALPTVFLAFLRGRDFGSDARALVVDDPHNIFPGLFVKDAAQRTSLKFVAISGQKRPDYPP
jgi:hypothetical protein